MVRFIEQLLRVRESGSGQTSWSERTQEGATQYVWLKGTEFSRTPKLDHVQITKNSYNQFAATYAELEYNPEFVSREWFNVFHHYFLELQQLKEGSRVLFGGVGAGRDAIIAALLSKMVVVDTYDQAGNMLNEAKKRLTWEVMEQFAKLIIQLEPKANGHISQIKHAMDQGKTAVELIKTIASTLPSFFSNEQEIEAIAYANQLSASMSNVDISLQILKGLVPPQVQERINFDQNDHLSVDYPHQYDLIFDEATLQHLDSLETEEAIARKLRMLKVGGKYHFSLRLEKSYLRLKGRIFADNVLNPDVPYKDSTNNLSGWRFYTTYSRRQASMLREKIESNQLQRLDPDSPSVTGKFSTKVVAYGKHPQNLKPGFLHLEVERIA